jgi:hypothetical protein
MTSRCGASTVERRDQVLELVASLRAAEGMYLEWRSVRRAGLRPIQESRRPLYERTRSFRAYATGLLPGILQTRAYTTAVLTAIVQLDGLVDDVAEAVDLRVDRTRLLYEGAHRTFAIILEETALSAGVGGVEVMAGQLGHLLTTASLPTVSLGVIPARADRDRAWPVEPFWIFDEEQAEVELVSGFLTLTKPRDVQLYAETFARFADIAVYGSAARTIVTAAIDKLSE